MTDEHRGAAPRTRWPWPVTWRRLAMWGREGGRALRMITAHGLSAGHRQWRAACLWWRCVERRLGERRRRLKIWQVALTFFAMFIVWLAFLLRAVDIMTR